MSNKSFEQQVAEHVARNGITRCPPMTATGGGSKQRSLASLAFQREQCIGMARLAAQSVSQASEHATR